MSDQEKKKYIYIYIYIYAQGKVGRGKLIHLRPSVNAYLHLLHYERLPLYVRRGPTSENHLLILYRKVCVCTCAFEVHFMSLPVCQVAL